jgi:hypothetical protein
MSRLTLRIFAPLALLAPLAGSAEASVGDSSGGALSSFGRLPPVQTVQYSGDCWYDNGSNGPGYYPCGNEWSNGLGGGGDVSPIVGPAIRRHHHHGVIVTHSQARNPVYPGAPSRRLGVGVPSPGLRGGGAAPAFAGGSRFHQFGAAGVHTSPGLHAGAATVFPGFVGGGLHGIGGATGVHIRAPASPSFAGVGTFHAGGMGAPHIGAPASPGFAGGGFHGVGAAGTFQGGGAAFGQGGIGHR